MGARISSADAVEQQWQHWTNAFWNGRLDSTPIPLTVDQATAMARWVLALTDSVDDGVAFATAHEGRLAGHRNLLHELAGEQLDRAPANYATLLLAHVLKRTKQPFWGCPDLAKIVPRLRAVNPPVDLSTILEQATRLGCANVGNW